MTDIDSTDYAEMASAQTTMRDDDAPQGQNDANDRTNTGNGERQRNKKKKNFYIFFQYYGGWDFVWLIILGLIGIIFPKVVFDATSAWKTEFPGQYKNFTYYDNSTGIYFETRSKVFLPDPAYNREHTTDDGETVDTNELLALAGFLPPVYALLFLFLLMKWPTRFREKRFNKEWIWFEFITFLYAFTITLSVAFWMTKVLKILVSWPRPDFYSRCELDASDPDNLQCTSLAEDEIRKSFKSFPSGHSTNVFATGVLLVMFTWNKINLREPMKWIDEKYTQHTWYYRPFVDTILLWPIILAGWVAATRVQDHLHSPTDILGGACIGYISGQIGYYSQYKYGSPWSYRLLFWKPIQRRIQQHPTLQRIMYPQLFEQETKSLIMEMTKYNNNDGQEEAANVVSTKQSEETEMAPIR